MSLWKSYNYIYRILCDSIDEHNLFYAKYNELYNKEEEIISDYSKDIHNHSLRIIYDVVKILNIIVVLEVIVFDFVNQNIRYRIKFDPNLSFEDTITKNKIYY